MKILDRYVAGSMLAGCLPVLLLLLSLFSLLALSDQLEDVGEGAFELNDALRVVALGIPALMVDLLPVTLLLGGLLGLGALSSNLELTALRAAAVSPLRLTLPIVACAVLLIGLTALLQYQVVPKLAFYSSQLKSKTLMPAPSLSLDEEQLVRRDSEFWTRTSGQLVRIGQVLPDRRLAGIEIYQLNERGELTELLQSESAQLLRDNAWQLMQVRKTQLQSDRSSTETTASMIWNELLSEEQTHALVTPASALAPGDLWRLIQRLDQNSMSSARHRVIFWKQMSIPLGLLGMALLTLPFLLGSVRSVSVGQRMTLGGIIGISYYLLQQISGHIAGILQFNIAVTVLAPGLAVLCLSLWLIWRVERG